MRALPMAVWFLAMLAGVGAAPASAAWKLERDVEPPSYAVIEPESSDLNIDSVVLACAATGNAPVLQLQIYLSTEGPLSPKGAAPQQLRGDPRAEIAIDGRIFPVGIFFADDHAVLADETEQGFPALSASLLDAMAMGSVMVLRFDLLAERDGQRAAFDGEAVIALHGDSGGAAVSAVRRCATTVSVASARHDRR
jgi:hypothetical protein